MSQHKENATSRPSSRESEKTVSSASSTTSVISETASKVVSETLDRAAANIGELMQSISRWEAECDGSEDNSSAACCNHQKLERQLQRFFSLRRVFAENQEETPEVTEEDLDQEGHHVPNTVSAWKSCDSDRTDEKSERRHGSKIYKKMKSAWKHCFRWKPRKKVQLAEEHDLDESAGSEGSGSKSSSPCPEETSPTPSIDPSEDIGAAGKADMDATYGSSLVLPGVEDVHEVIGSVSTDVAPGCASPEVMSTIDSIGSSENIVVAEKEDQPVTDMDATHGPSLVLPGAEDVCETILTVSTQKSCDSDRTDEKPAGGHGSKIYKKLKSAWKSNFKWKPKKKVQLVAEHDLDETARAEGSDQPVKSGSPCPEETSPTASMCSSEDIRDSMKADLSSDPLELADNVEHKDITPETNKGPSPLSPTGSSQPMEDCEERSAFMEEDLVKNMDLQPGPSGQDGHLESSQVHLGAKQNVDDMETASSNLTSDRASPTEMSPFASTGSNEDITAAEMANLSSVPLEDVTPQGVMEDNKDASPEPSLDITAAEMANLSSVPLEDVTPQGVMEDNKDASPGPSLDITAAEMANLSSVPLEDVTPHGAMEDNKDASSGPSLDITAAEMANLSSVPLEDVTPQGVMEDNKDASPGPSLDITAAEMANLSSVPLEDVTPQGVTEDNKDASPGPSLDITAAEMANLSSVPLEDVPPQGVMEDNTGASPGPSLDITAAMGADLSSATLVTPEEKEDAVLEPFTTTSLSSPVEHLSERSSVTDKDLAMYRDSTPGPSGQDRNLEGSQDDNGAAAVAHITGLKNIFYNIIKEFFDSLTEEQRQEISKDVYNLDVKDKLADMCVKVLKLVIETITDVLSQAIYQSAPPYSTLTTKSPTSSQVCGTEAVGQKLLSELLREEDNISQSLKGSLGKAFCDVVGADTSISISPKSMEAIVRAITTEVNSVLSETVQASMDGESSNVHAVTCCQFSSCRTCKEILARVIWAMNTFLTALGTTIKKTNQTVKVHKKTSPWWSCLRKGRKNKVHPTSDLQVDEAVKLSSSKLLSGHKNSSSSRATSCSVRSSKLNSTPLDLVDCVEDATSEETGNTSSLYSIGWFPSACPEDEVPDYRESPLVSKTRETEIRSSSCHQCGDSANRNCQTDVEEVVMASDTDVNKIQAEKSSRLCRIFHKGKKKEDKASTHQTVRTKGPSLLKRIWLFCCRLSCCSHNDGT